MFLRPSSRFSNANSYFPVMAVNIRRGKRIIFNESLILNESHRLDIYLHNPVGGGRRSEDGNAMMESYLYISVKFSRTILHTFVLFCLEMRVN